MFDEILFNIQNNLELVKDLLERGYEEDALDRLDKVLKFINTTRDNI